MLGIIRLPVAWVASRPVAVPAWLGPAVVDLFASSLSEQGIWLAFGVSNVLAAGIAAAWFLRGTWRDADPREAGEAVVADD
jgi:Na+-driven multidrug efflux pump